MDRSSLTTTRRDTQRLQQMSSYMISEGKWTKPRADCPHPEYWHAPDPDTTEEEVQALVGGFIRALQPEFVIETGTAFGYTAEVIGHNLDLNLHGRLLTLETNKDRADIARKRTQNLPVTVIQESSLKWEVPETIRGKVGFMWLDSLHQLRVDELRRFTPYLAPIAIVGVHDTGPHHPFPLGGDLEAELRQTDTMRPIYLPTPRGVTFIEYNKDGV